MKFQSVAVVVVLFFALKSTAQTTVFTYQGQLNSNGVAANGLYDLRFRLFDADTNIVGNPFTNAPTGVTNGFFVASLDFGSTNFNGSDRWLEIAVRNYGDNNSYVPLSPLQPITSVPYAIRSINASNLTSPLRSTNLTGIIPITNLPVNVAFLNSNQMFTGANTFAGTVAADNAANHFTGTFVGDGGGLTSLPTTNLTGTLPDARLSANVALQSNTVINFAGSVGATNFIGAGHGLTNVPGAFFWVVPTNGQMYPNVGYICTNDADAVTLTLPASPDVGDTFKVCGIGAAGWVIAQNNGQNILAGNLSGSVGQSWKTNGIAANWGAIGCSSDGTKMVAVVGDTIGNAGQIYTNDNFGGGAWTAKQNSRQWIAVASSSDGTKWVAANYGGSGQGIWTSTDSGGTWAQHSTVSSVVSVTSSADGNKLAAVVFNGSLYTNNPGNNNWTADGSAGSHFWTSIDSSSDGTKLVAVEGGGGIYVSSNSGKTWQSSTNVGTMTTFSVACSSDGTRIIAVGWNGSANYVFLSTDSGATWSQQSLSSSSGQLLGVASSSDGSRLFVIGGNSSSGRIFASFDSGVTWTTLSAAPTASWSGITCSADGSTVAATAYGGKIYISSQSSTTIGSAGYLSGAQHSAIELIYAGDGNFLPLNHEGTIRAY